MQKQHQSEMSLSVQVAGSFHPALFHSHIPPAGSEQQSATSELMRSDASIWLPIHYSA